MPSEPRVRITGQLILGVAIATAGVLFTLDNLHILRARDYLQFWPLVLVAIGLVHLSQANTGAGMLGGGIWIAVGGLMLANRMGLVHTNIWNLWPLLLVLVGARIALQTISVEAPRRVGGLAVLQGDPVNGQAGGDAGSVVSAVAVMGGFDRKVTSQAFRGGELTAFMGGGKLDLRDALPANGQATVNVFALMGGFEIFVPDTWSVSLEVTPFMGGVEDKARTSTSPSAPRLVVRGFVMMSSVEIKNA
jgi:predicted membrane protein